MRKKRRIEEKALRKEIMRIEVECIERFIKQLDEKRGDKRDVRKN
jgi:hypothetical protein